MNLYLLFLVIISLFGIEIYVKKFNPSYLSIETTSCIKGLFVLIVFFSHISGYIDFNSTNDLFMNKLSLFLGQLMVTMFLFYSGYGIYESIKKKKSEYIKTIPKKRIIKTILHFFIAVLTFLIVGICIGKNYKLLDIILAFVGWNSIGNSNWYIFIIVFLYFITYLSFKVFSNHKNSILSVWILSMIFLLVLKNCRPTFWYDTLLCYPLGISFSYYKSYIEKYLFNNKKYILSLFILSILFCIFRLYAHSDVYFYELMSIVFSLIIVLLTMKVNIASRVLKWFGDRLFLVYIFQRIPMIIFKDIGSLYPYTYFVLSFIVMIIIVVIYQYIFNKIDLIFEKKKVIN